MDTQAQIGSVFFLFSDIRFPQSSGVANSYLVVGLAVSIITRPTKETTIPIGKVRKVAHGSAPKAQLLSLHPGKSEEPTIPITAGEIPNTCPPIRVMRPAFFCFSACSLFISSPQLDVIQE